MSKILVIDLKKKISNIVNWDKPFVGSGYLSALLLNYFSSKGFNSPLIIAGGALSGLPTVGTSVVYVSMKSPQSGGIVESKVEGRLAPAMHSIDLSAIVFLNSAKTLTGINITAELEIKYFDESNLKGYSVSETFAYLESKTEKNSIYGCISGFGESGLIFSSIVFDRGFPTPTGGAGAVMGSLNLKYFGLESTVPQFNDRLTEISKNYSEKMLLNPLTLSEYKPPGMGVWTIDANLPGYLGAHNFTKSLSPSVIDFHKNQRPEDFFYEAENLCQYCPQSCLKRVGNTNDGGDFDRLHQIALAIWVSQCGFKTLDGALDFNRTCHENGLEHLYLGALLAHLCEIGESISFGDEETAINLINDWLHNPQTIPKKIPTLKDGNSLTIKGMPIPPWDFRGAQGLGLIMSINPSGPRYDVVEHDIDFDPKYRSDIAQAHHLQMALKHQVPSEGFQSAAMSEEKAIGFSSLWHLWSAMDGLGICTYAGPPTRELTESDIFDIYKSQIGEQITLEQFINIGIERIVAQRLFNENQNLTGNDDLIPERFFMDPIQDGLYKGLALNYDDIAKAKKIIYKKTGLNEDGQVDKNSSYYKNVIKNINNIKEKIGI